MRSVYWLFRLSGGAIYASHADTEEAARAEATYLYGNESVGAWLLGTTDDPYRLDAFLYVADREEGKRALVDFPSTPR